MANSSNGHSQKRLLAFAVTYLVALATMLLIYLMAERHYFTGGKTDFAMLGYAAPRMALVALLPSALSAWLALGKPWLQIVLGFLGGPLIGWAAIKLVHIYGVLS